LFASQLHHAIAREVYKGADPATVIYVGNKDVGAFMKKRVFELGRTLSWNALTKHATGEELNAKAFAADFKEKVRHQINYYCRRMVLLCVSTTTTRFGHL